jgi:hypothetical protein
MNDFREPVYRRNAGGGLNEASVSAGGPHTQPGPPEQGRELCDVVTCGRPNALSWMKAAAGRRGGTTMTTPARFLGHPIHVVLIPLPLGLWTFSLVADVAAAPRP